MPRDSPSPGRELAASGRTPDARPLRGLRPGGSSPDAPRSRIRTREIVASTIRLRRRARRPVDSGDGVSRICGFRGVEIPWKTSCPSAPCGIGTATGATPLPAGDSPGPEVAPLQQEARPPGSLAQFKGPASAGPLNARIPEARRLRRRGAHLLPCRSPRSRLASPSSCAGRLTPWSRRERPIRAGRRSGCTASAPPSRPARSPSPRRY